MNVVSAEKLTRLSTCDKMSTEIMAKHFPGFKKITLLDISVSGFV